MSGSPGKDARAAFKRPAVYIPIIVVLLGGTILFWILGFRWP